MKNIMIMSMLFVSIAYAVTTTEVFVDSKTKLEWQNQSINKTAKVADWVEAIDYCEDLELESKNDWRLPNIIELKSLIDYERYEPAIVSALIDTSANGYYWSATSASRTTKKDEAFFVGFGSGYSNTISKSTSSNYVRCVRDN